LKTVRIFSLICLRAGIKRVLSERKALPIL
jgi:hypothetical protein